jgi:hypothetical protein
LPTTTFDTFFACTILVAAALIATAFFTSNMQIRIDNTQDLNKNSYLNAIADRFVNSPGTPPAWGTNQSLPEDFGLAQAQSFIPYELDPDKVSRLNSQNNNSLTYTQLVQSAKLDNLAFGVSISQLMTINIAQTENHTVGGNTAFTFAVSVTANSKPADASFHAYLLANNHCSETSGSLPNGLGELNVEVPSSATDSAFVIVFARASFDDRVTSYGVYSFSDGAEQSAPSNSFVSLSALDYNLTVTTKGPDVTLQKGYLLSYAYQANLTVSATSATPFPQAIDKSPFVIVVCGQNGAEFFEEWTSYPQVPLTAGSSFSGSERTVFIYVVTIKNSLYKLDLSFGGIPS